MVRPVSFDRNTNVLYYPSNTFDDFSLTDLVGAYVITAKKLTFYAQFFSKPLQDYILSNNITLIAQVDPIYAGLFEMDGLPGISSIIWLGEQLGLYELNP
jgi:hypothetical protein